MKNQDMKIEEIRKDIFVLQHSQGATTPRIPMGSLDPMVKAGMARGHVGSLHQTMQAGMPQGLLGGLDPMMQDRAFPGMASKTCPHHGSLASIPKAGETHRHTSNSESGSPQA